jgi:hypothetical protein
MRCDQLSDAHVLLFQFYDGGVMPRNNAPKDTLDLVQQWWAVHDRHVSKWVTWRMFGGFVVLILISSLDN